MPSSRPLRSALGSPLAASAEISLARGPKPAGLGPPAPGPAGLKTDAVTAFLDSLLEQYEKTATLLRSKSGSTHPL